MMNTKDRGLKAFRAARDELGVNDCTIVTCDSQYQTEDGIWPSQITALMPS